MLRARGGPPPRAPSPHSALNESPTEPNYALQDDGDYPHARRVYYRVTLLRMEEVSTTAQTWSGEIYYEFAFAVHKEGPQGHSDEKRRKLAEEVSAVVSGNGNVTADLPFADVFWPQISFARGETQPDECWVKTLSDDLRHSIARAEGISEGQYHFLSFNLRAVRTFSQQFPLELFPLDMQMLMARIVLRQGRPFFFFAYSKENCAVMGDLTSINAVNGAHSPMMGEWRLRRRTCAVSCLSSKEASRSKTQYPVLKTLILVKRRWGLHLWLFVFPLLAIFLLSVLVLLSEMENSDRYAATSALLFAAIQIKAQVAALLPRLHASTLLDKATLFVILFVFATALASFLSKHSPRVDVGVIIGGAPFALHLLWQVVERLVLKKRAFLLATNFIYKRKSGQRAAPCCARVWRLLTRRKGKDAGGGHPNVPDNHDTDAALEEWPGKGAFGVDCDEE